MDSFFKGIKEKPIDCILIVGLDAAVERTTQVPHSGISTFYIFIRAYISARVVVYLRITVI